MKIYIASDHGGYKLKEELRKYLVGAGNQVSDCGNTAYDPVDDYPDFAVLLSEKVSRDKNSRGILLCRNGVGVSIVANRHPEVRAVSTLDSGIAKSSRADDNTNVLCLPADYISGVKAKKLVKEWLRTPFSGEARHKRRLKKINRVISCNKL